VGEDFMFKLVIMKKKRTNMQTSNGGLTFSCPLLRCLGIPPIHLQACLHAQIRQPEFFPSPSICCSLREDLLLILRDRLPQRTILALPAILCKIIDILPVGIPILDSVLLRKLPNGVVSKPLDPVGAELDGITA
jgi:hypothetical protein